MIGIERVLTAGADRVSCFIPWSRQRKTCFFNMRPHGGGPGIFLVKLSREFSKRDIAVTYGRLRSAQGALLFSRSWNGWFYQLCRLWGVRTVLRVDGFPVPNYFDNRQQPPGHQDRQLKIRDMALNYRLQRDLLLADFVIFQSMFCKQMTDHFLYNRRDRYAVVFNGVDLANFQPGPKRSGRRRLLIAGSLRHEYTLGSVLPVFGRLWQKHDLELVVIGNMDTICRQQLEAFVQTHPDVTDRINMLGRVANDGLPQYMQQADVFVHPRLGDWCPNVVVEAMACGLPVVCGSWGGAAELVGDGGVIVPTGEWTYGEDFIAALSTGVEVLLSDLTTYKSKARARAEEAFDIAQVADMYAEHLSIQ